MAKKMSARQVRIRDGFLRDIPSITARRALRLANKMVDGAAERASTWMVEAVNQRFHMKGSLRFASEEIKKLQVLEQEILCSMDNKHPIFSPDRKVVKGKDGKFISVSKKLAEMKKNPKNENLRVILRTIRHILPHLLAFRDGEEKKAKDKAKAPKKAKLGSVGIALFEAMNKRGGGR